MLFKWMFLCLICAVPTIGSTISLRENELSWLEEEKISNFKIKLKKVFEELAFLKRAMELEHNMVPYISTNKIWTESTIGIKRGCTVRVSGAELVFAVTSDNSLAELRNGTIFPIFTKYHRNRDFLSLQALVDGPGVILIAQHTNEKFRYFVNIYGYDYKHLKRKHKINLNGISLVSTTKIGAWFYMVIVPKNLAFPTLKVYQLAGVQYARIADIRVNASCSGLETWSIGGTLNVALSYVDSGRLEILRFLEYSRTFSRIQVIDVHAFVLKLIKEPSNTYLICGTRKSVILYWWTGYRFREMHSKLFQKEIVDISAHNALGQIVIAVVFHDSVEFLTQDSSARYVSAGTLAFTPANSMNSVLLWKDRRRLFMVPLLSLVPHAFVARKKPLTVFEVDLKFDVADPPKEQALKKCINTLELQMTEREKFIEGSNSKFKKLWRPSKPSRISHLIVKGSIKSSSNSTIRTMHLNNYLSSLMSLRMQNVESVESTEKLRSLLSKSVHKSGEQLIHCNMKFSNLTVQQGRIGQLLNDTKINEVSCRRLSCALKKKGQQQTFPYKTTVFTAYFNRVTTNLLNKKKIEDYVLLNKGPWNMTGHFTFSDVTAKYVKADSINDIDVPKIVLRSKNQEISGLKRFKKLYTKSIRTNNQQYARRKLKDLAYLNQFQIPVRFDSDIRIKGKLSVSSINGKNLNHQLWNTVRRNDDQDIFGSKVFHSVIVHETMTVVGGINNFTTKNLMTVSTDQNLTGNFRFSERIVSHKNISTSSLNGYDLKSEAVKKNSSKSEMKGVKTFKESLKVSDITMDDGVLIDYFDPSDEFSRIFKASSDASSGIHLSQSMTFGNITVGNLTVRRRNFPILKELDKVWLKTNVQNITTLKTQSMNVSEMIVYYMNGINTDNLVPVYEDSILEGMVTFENTVSTKTLSLQTGAQVDYPLEFWNPYVNVKIYGNITIENPVVEGNVIVSDVLNSLDSGFMSTAASQFITGTVQFKTVKLNELKARELDFSSVNKWNFKEYFDSAVRKSKDKYLYNKSFRMLNGTAMKCYGTLNSVSMDKIATINTPQNFTSLYKLNNFTATKAITAKFLNGIQLEKVVCKDTNNRTSNKHFTGNITTLYMNIDENINGVNLAKLNKEAFRKIGYNKITARMTFCENITLDELQISSNKTIDGVNLADLIMINGTISLHSFNVSIFKASINAEHVFVKGLINGCNIRKIVENALLLKQNTQNITGKVHVNTLEVIGNLGAEYVNGADVSAWIAVLNTASTSDTYSDVTFEHLIADDIHITNTVDNVDLEYLFHDSARRNSSQTISGQKRFRTIEVKNINISKVDSNKTCGIDLLDVYENYVNRTAGKEIILNSSLKLAHLEVNNMTIDGKLNELKFPVDVILSNISEHIEDDVIIYSYMNATGGLKVTGKIDGVEMKPFLQDRVTLYANENVSAVLIFENNTHISEKTLIHGLVNKISLDHVVKVLQSYSVSGQKIFLEELDLMSDVTVRKYVNDKLIGSLDKSVLRVSRNETSLKGVMKFSKLSLSSLISVTVNGINVKDFFKNTHRFVHETRDNLYNFTYHIQDHEELMRAQRDTSEHPLSLFNAFELHTILNFGIIEKFLPLYEFGAFGPKYELHVTNMILWVKHESNDTGACRSTLSITAEVSSDGSFVRTSRKWGKVFPFSLSSDRDGVDGFLVQAEYSNCSEEQKIRISALGSPKLKKVFIKPPANATLLDVHFLEVEDVYLIFSYSISGSYGSADRILMFRFEISTNEWKPHQSFFSQEPTSVNVITVDDELLNAPLKVYLSVTGDKVNPGVTIYEWDSNQFILKTNISTSVSSYAYWVVNHNTLYLLLSKEDRGLKCQNSSQKAIFTEALEVYTLDEELVLNHTVAVPDVTSMDAFMLAEETFVLATCNRKGMVYVLQFRGYNGFEVVQAIHSPGATEARVFTVDGHLYVAINSETGLSSKGVVLKTTIIGGRQGFHLE